jgi:hypothetical protein
MSKNFQQCSHLQINDDYSNLLKEGKDSLSVIFELQKDIQEKVYQYDFDDIRSSIRKLKSFIDLNEEAIRDEDREFQSALTGIHTFPDCWKPWKANHSQAMDRSFSDLSEDELKELQFEWIDKLHFMLNEAIAINLTPELIVNYYLSKNQENRDRQARGY